MDGTGTISETPRDSASAAAPERPRGVRRTLENRPGRVVAVGRAILSLYFIFVMWADPRQPEVLPGFANAFLGGYAGLAAAYLLITWNRWWLEASLSLPFHAVDLIVFAGLNYVTSGYASPFFLFFIFILLSSSLRWGWRETLATAAALLAIYAVEGITASTWGTENFDLERFALRVMYMVVFAVLLLVWFASRSAVAAPVLPHEVQPKGAEQFLREAIAGIAARLGGDTAVAVWSDEEEPWRYVVAYADGEVSVERLEPDAYEPVVSPAAGDRPFIFDRARRLVLSGRSPRRRTERVPQPIHAGLAERYGLACGIRLPLSAGAIGGELLVGGVAGLSPDDLDTAAALHEEISGALERAELVHANERAALMRARLSFARDVHDGMIQVLAGVTLRLEGLKRRGTELAPEIDELQAELAREQQDLRALIRRLKGSGFNGTAVDAAATLGPLAERLARQWGIELRVKAPKVPVLVDEPLQTEIQHLVREAAANAVRHGGAHRVDVVLGRDEEGLSLRISDDGRGLDRTGRFGHEEIAAARIGSRSIFERVHQRGGRLAIESGRRGTRLSIQLPITGLAA